MTVARRSMPTCHRPRTFSLAEAVIAIAIVGVMLVAALHTAGAARLGEQKTGDRGKGMLLAQQLMSEILQQSYEEPVDPPVFGPEVGEATGSRTSFDDVDDYDGWSASPPEQKDGTVIPGLDGWTRSVRVERVDPADLSQVVASDTRIKRITVRVARDDAAVAAIAAVRTGAGDCARGDGIGG
jgi:type II secretory pathway pseudopilin PulG